MLASPGYCDVDRPAWALRMSSPGKVSCDRSDFTYELEPDAFELAPGKARRIALQLDYACPDKSDVEAWAPGAFLDPAKAEDAIGERRAEWARILANADDGSPDTLRKMRASAILYRCGCRWGNVVANFCSVTSWASTAFMWDSIVSAAGLMQVDVGLAQDALRAIFLRQREDGCIPTHAYEHAVGSTFYPQAAIGGWAVVHMIRYGADEHFLAEILPKLDRLHGWFTRTQDHDGDGLPEWRFTGQAADNSPVYDRYAAHIGKPLDGFWNVYLPPVASVSCVGFFIMDARCLSWLHGRMGDEAKCRFYREEAERLGARLHEVCMTSSGLFHDYDHHLGCFNEVVTLYSFLPLWAGAEPDDAAARKAIETWLLAEGHFFGEWPLPFLAYSEEAYKPDGYWRGRIWPHVACWMLELLWSYGYEAQADEMADRLLKMMDRRPEILENYFSDPARPGGGEVDYSWSGASYLFLSNRLYRMPALRAIAR
jgi:glycogen debranching enzyme